MKKLFFTRHGLTVLNVAGKWSGSTDTPLTDEGRNQAKIAGQNITHEMIDLIVASPLSRAHETAEIIAREINYPLEKIVLNELLVERHFGALEGQTWDPHMNLEEIENIETSLEILERARRALKWLHTLDAEHILVVSHGAFGRALRSLLVEEFPFDHPTRLTNAEVHQWL